MGKFVIKNAKKGFNFVLKAGNGQVIATSEVYESEKACKAGIASVQKCAAEAAIEDQTVEGFATEKNPKFEIYKDKKGEFRFRLKAKNGEIISRMSVLSLLDASFNSFSCTKKRISSISMGFPI